MNAEKDTQEGDMLDALTTLIEAYERKTFPIEDIPGKADVPNDCTE